jgi:hypothetical protein
VALARVSATVLPAGFRSGTAPTADPALTLLLHYAASTACSLDACSCVAMASMKSSKSPCSTVDKR